MAQILAFVPGKQRAGAEDLEDLNVDDVEFDFDIMADEYDLADE